MGQLSEMIFPPVENMLEEYPILTKFPETKDLENDQLKYLSLFTDPNSIISQKILDQRVEDCRIESGYKGEVDSDCMLDAMTRMLYLADDLRFNRWVSLRMAYSNILERLRKPVDETEITEDGKTKHLDEDKVIRSYAIFGKCSEISKEMQTEIIELETYLFPNSKVKKDILVNVGRHSVESLI